MSKTQIDYNDYILYLETLHGNTLKTLFEYLKDAISDVNITFDHKTFSVLRMNEGHTLLVYLQMFAEEFDNYHILEPFVAGLNIHQLFKVLKPISNNDILHLMITKNDPNTLVVVIENLEKGEYNEYEVPILDINEDELGVPDLDFTFMITMDPGNFQKITRNLKNLGVELVQITYSKEGLEFRGKGEVKAKNVLRPSQNRLKIETNDQNDSNVIYQGIFELDKLVKCTKCTTLSDEVKLLLMNDYPLVLISDIGGLGENKLCLAPANNPDE